MSAAVSLRRERAVFAAGVSAIVVLAASLRLPGLAPPSLYFDDVWVALFAREASLAELLAIKPHHPAGFMALQALALRVLPGAELPVQLLPFAASLAIIPLGAWLVRRRTGGVSGGLLAAVLLALNPTLSDYSVRAKPYATDALLSLVLGAATLACLREPEPRRLRRLAFLAPLAVLFSYPAALVGAVGFAVALSAAFASSRQRGPLMRIAGAFVAAETALGIVLVYGQSNQSLQRFWEYGFVPRGSPSDALAFVASRTALVFVSSFPRDWWALGILVPLGFALLLWRRETRSAAAFVAALWTALFAVSAMRLYPMDGRTTSFAYPLVALVAAATISAQMQRARQAVVREGVLAFLAAAVVLTSASRVAYPAGDDARLVRTLVAESEPGDTVLIYPHANWTAGYYSGWPVRLVPVDYYGTRFEARLLRDRSVVLRSFPGYENHPEVLDPALEELVSRKPDRVLYVAINLAVNRTAAHAHILKFFGASGYRSVRLAVAEEGEVLRFSRQPPLPDSGAPPGLPQGGESRPGPGSSTPAGP
ncbi:MAG: glycosyltransferase family 39 protein [Thermoanaerobaculia bacterium]|nr:glycosyltransferase family 39 protein [Thermoanaerobaculia bacterium]